MVSSKFLVCLYFCNTVYLLELGSGVISFMGFLCFPNGHDIQLFIYRTNQESGNLKQQTRFWATAMLYRVPIFQYTEVWIAFWIQGVGSSSSYTSGICSPDLTPNSEFHFYDFLSHCWQNEMFNDNKIEGTPILKLANG